MATSTKNAEMPITEYTITVFTENVPGLLSEVVSVFTRIKMNIDTLTVSA